MKQKITSNRINTARLPGSFIEFLRFFLNYHELIQTPKVFLAPGELLLFNPAYSSNTLLSLFLTLSKSSPVRNSIGELFERNFALFNWYENPYFFVIKKDNHLESKAGNAELWDQSLILFQMEHDTNMSMTLSEMIIYHLYLQWQGQPTATPDCIVVTQTRVFNKNLNDDVLVTIGLDEDLVETKINSHSPPELFGKNVIFKETYRYPM